MEQDELRQALEDWEQTTLKDTLDKYPERYDEFITKVESALRPIPRAGAKRAAVSTLSILSELLTPEAVENLEAHLPAEFAKSLDHDPPDDPEAELSLEEFCELVAETEGAGVALDDARHHATGVMRVVREVYGVGLDLSGKTIAGSELEMIREELPEEFAPLFT